MTTNSLNNETYADFTIKNGASGSARVLRIENENDTVSSSAAIETQVGGTSADDTYFRYLISTTNSWAHGIDQTDTQSFNTSYTAGATATPSSTKAIKSTTSGELLYPSQPLFKAYMTAGASNISGDNTDYQIPYNLEQIDQNSNYNTGTYFFTAPKAGKYFFAAGVVLSGYDSGHIGSWLMLQLNSSTIRSQMSTYAYNHRMASYDTLSYTISMMIDLAANDTVHASTGTRNGNKIVDIVASATQQTFFAGCLLG